MRNTISLLNMTFYHGHNLRNNDFMISETTLVMSHNLWPRVLYLRAEYSVCIKESSTDQNLWNKSVFSYQLVTGSISLFGWFPTQWSTNSIFVSGLKISYLMTHLKEIIFELSRTNFRNFSKISLVITKD